MRRLFHLALAALLLPCAALAQNSAPANADRFPYPGEAAPPVSSTPPAAPTPTQPAKPLIVPKGMLQANPHTAEVKVVDPPCLVPSDGTSYGYTLGRGVPDRRAELRDYFWEVHKRIYDHWLLNAPRMAKAPWLKKGIVGVKATIDKDGTVEMPFVTLSAPHDGFDEHVVKSLEEMSPLPPLPAGVESLRACIFFYYNIPIQQAPQKHDYDGWLDKANGTSAK